MRYNNSKNVTPWTITCALALGALTGCGSPGISPGAGVDGPDLRVVEEMEFILSWSEPLADLDLMIIEPDGSVVSREYYGTHCLLDLDFFEGPATERVICLEPENGEYQVVARSWSGAADFVVAVDEGQGPFKLGRGFLGVREEMTFLHGLF